MWSFSTELKPYKRPDPVWLIDAPAESVAQVPRTNNPQRRLTPERIEQYRLAFGQEPRSKTDIAKLLGQTRDGVKHSIYSLEAKGLIESVGKRNRISQGQPEILYRWVMK